MRLGYIHLSIVITIEDPLYLSHTRRLANEYLLQVCHYVIYLYGMKLLIDVELPHPYTWHCHNHVSSFFSNLTIADTKIGNLVVRNKYHKGLFGTLYSSYFIVNTWSGLPWVALHNTKLLLSLNVVRLIRLSKVRL